MPCRVAARWWWQLVSRPCARATPEIEAGQYVCLSLTDSGEGMDQATLAKAAEPFFTTKGPGKGTGLGLAMVYGSVTQIGGRVVLKSETGRGTTAELWLPVVTDLTSPSLIRSQAC